jgi:hypothetical protein
MPIKHDNADAKRRVDDMPHRQHDRLAGHASIKLQERDDRSGKGDGTDCNAKRHLDQCLRVDFAHLADTEGMRRIKRRRSHQHGGKADQAVKASDQLRHRCHRDLARDVGTRTAADGETRYDQHKSPNDGCARSSVVTMAMAMPIMP